MIAALVPIVVFGIVQIRTKSFEGEPDFRRSLKAEPRLTCRRLTVVDFNTAVFGVLYSLINAAVFQVFIK